MVMLSSPGDFRVDVRSLFTLHGYDPQDLAPFPKPGWESTMKAQLSSNDVSHVFILNKFNEDKSRQLLTSPGLARFASLTIDSVEPLKLNLSSPKNAMVFDPCD
jgi:hypothetical protein